MRHRPRGVHRRDRSPDTRSCPATSRSASSSRSGPAPRTAGVCSRAIGSRSRCSCRAASATRAAPARTNAARATASPTCTDSSTSIARPACGAATRSTSTSRPTRCCAAVPDSLDAVTATMFNPLGAGIRWAVTVPGTGPGDVVAVLGPGVRGLSACAAAKHAGAGFVMITGRGGRDAPRLAVAAEFGADLAVDVDQRRSGARAARRDRRSRRRRGRRHREGPGRVRAGDQARSARRHRRGRGNAWRRWRRDRRSIPIRSSTRSCGSLGALGVDTDAYAAALELLAARRFPFEALPRRVVGLDDVGDLLAVDGRRRAIRPPVHAVVVPEAECAHDRSSTFRSTTRGSPPGCGGRPRGGGRARGLPRHRARRGRARHVVTRGRGTRRPVDTVSEPARRRAGRVVRSRARNAFCTR